MNDPAFQLLELDSEALSRLHESLHDKTDAPVVELHHLVTTEMLKRGIAHGHIDDFWTETSIEISYIQNVDLNSLGEGYSTDFLDEIRKSTESVDMVDVTTLLTVDGYALTIQPVFKSSIKVGSSVSYAVPKPPQGTQYAKGVVTRIEKTGVVKLRGTQESLEASEDEPVAVIRVYAVTEDGYEETDREVIKYISDLRVAEEIEKASLSQKVEETLSRKVAEHNEKVDDASKKATLGMLRQSFKRGIGAYRTNPSSVRPNVVSSEQWAFGRVNGLLYALKTGKYKRSPYDTDLLPDGHPLASKGKVEKMIRQEDGKYVVYNEDGTRKFGTYDTQEEASRRLEQMHRFSKAKETHTPPSGVQEAAQRALDWIKDGQAGKGFTMTGRRRANQLAAGEAVTTDTVRRMRSFLARHQVDKKAEGFNRGEKGYPSPGRVAWDAWGGDAGKAWANSILGDVEKAYDPMEALNQRQMDNYRDLENSVAEFGIFNQSADANGAHYFKGDENPFAGEGLHCSNCVFYQGGGACEIVEGVIDPLGLCKLWIIPEVLIEKEGLDYADIAVVAIEKHNEGGHDQKTHGSWADGIAKDILDGKNPTIEAENLTAFLGKASSRDDHPDITELKIDGTMLFGDEGLGIARKDMPQVPSDRRPEFLKDIESQGITATRENVDPRTLRPSQKEVSATRSGGIYKRHLDNKAIPEKKAILISKDGFVIDGHHNWAASVGFAFDYDAKLPVYRLSVNAKEALKVALEWSSEKGIESQAIDAKFKKMLLAFAKHKDHDQSSHGNWAEGARRERLLSDGNFRQPELIRDASGKVVNTNATGGYKANIPELIQFQGETITPAHSLWHHLESDGSGGYRITQERSILHKELVDKATKNVTKSSDPTFYLLGGGPASGKTSIVRSGLAGFDNANKVLLNADDVKSDLPENSRMRQSAQDADFFNAAAFAHEESSLVTRMIQKVAQRGSKDIVLDGTGDSKIEKLTAKVNEATQAGYKVKATYVTIPTEMAWQRSVKRATEENRFVPEYVVRNTHADISRVFPTAIERRLFDEVTLFDNSGATPRIIGRGGKGEFEVLDQDLYDAFLEKGK